jgi:hypothetical protein
MYFIFWGAIELPEHVGELKEFGLYFSSILVADCLFSEGKFIPQDSQF